MDLSGSHIVRCKVIHWQNICKVRWSAPKRPRHHFVELQFIRPFISIQSATCGIVFISCYCYCRYCYCSSSENFFADDFYFLPCFYLLVFHFAVESSLTPTLTQNILIYRISTWHEKRFSSSNAWVRCANIKTYTTWALNTDMTSEAIPQSLPQPYPNALQSTVLMVRTWLQCCGRLAESKSFQIIQ